MYLVLYALVSSTPISPDASASGAFPADGAKLGKGADQLEQGSSDRRPMRLVLLGVIAAVSPPAHLTDNPAVALDELCLWQILCLVDIGHQSRAMEDWDAPRLMVLAALGWVWGRKAAGLALDHR
jgi:hypothetical protein